MSIWSSSTSMTAKGYPPVDLIIRTGNECRTSNFLPMACKRP